MENGETEGALRLTAAIGESRKQIGQILSGLVGLRPEQVAEGLDRQRLLAAKHRYYLLGRILIGLGYVTVDHVNAAVAMQQPFSPKAVLNNISVRGLAPEHRESWEVSTHVGPLRPVSAMRTLSQIDEKVLAGELESLRAVPLGFDPLDEALAGGVRPGELLLLGGSQGVGKTTMAFQMARNIAASQEASCLYICYEHDEENLTQRLISMESIDPFSQDIKLGVTVRELTNQIVNGRRRSHSGLFDLLQTDPRSGIALQRLSKYGDRLFLLKGSGARTTLNAIANLVEAYRVRTDNRLVLFIDYLQKVPVLPEPPNEQERVTKVAEGLKELALSQQIPVVATVAADREGLKAKRLRPHHFWGGSALAYEADVILVLAEKYDSVARVHIEFNPQKAEGFRDWLVCSLEKNRSGRNVVDMEFEKRFSYCCLNPNGNLVTEKLIDERLYVE